mmetsp:Transcript_4629/g.13398  ORF Transcript_4629/g.13398 Transcript_4629/m.13398 type:complete len:133 (+) Transcript_4629:920-1318(+)
MSSPGRNRKYVPWAPRKDTRRPSVGDGWTSGSGVDVVVVAVVVVVDVGVDVDVPVAVDVALDENVVVVLLLVVDLVELVLVVEFVRADGRGAIVPLAGSRVVAGRVVLLRFPGRLPSESSEASSATQGTPTA